MQIKGSGWGHHLWWYFNYLTAGTRGGGVGEEGVSYLGVADPIPMLPRGSLQYWCEGWALTVIICFGASANIFALLIIRSRELNLMTDFSRLLQSQAAYDICYLLMNIPAFVVPSLTNSSEVTDKLLPVLPFIMPLIQICITGKKISRRQ